MTGLTNELIKLTYDHLSEIETPFERTKDRFETFNKAITYLRMYEQALNGQSYWEITKSFLWTKLLERLENEASDLLGPNFGTALAVFRIYKAALEILNDLGVKPATRQAIYECYRDRRRQEDPYMAFTNATGVGMDYYRLKEDMFKALIRKKGMTAEQVGEKGESKLADKLWGEIDAFWRSELEAEYQADLKFRAESSPEARQARTDQVRRKYQQEIEVLRLAAASNVPGHLRFTVTDLLDPNLAISRGLVQLKTLIGRPGQCEAQIKDGVAEFNQIPGGQYLATLTAPGYAPRQGRLTLLTFEEPNVEKKTYLSPLIVVTLTVKNTADGQPVSGGDVLAKVEDNGREVYRRTASTGPAGQTQFSDLPNGTLYLLAKKTGFENGTGRLPLTVGRLRQISYEISLDPAAQEAALNLGVRATNRLDGAPVAAFQVALQAITPGAEILQANGQNGVASFANLRAGSYRYSARATGFEQQNGTVELASEGTAQRQLVLALTPTILPKEKPRNKPELPRENATDTATNKPPVAKVEPPKPQAKPPAKPAEPNYAAMAGQCNAIYAAAMQRRFAKYKDGATYKVEFRKPWTWNAARNRFECDIAIWQTGPAKNQDPKTFKPYITSELNGALSAGEAQSNIQSGKWFGE
jgi:hypothetical protein